MLESEQCRGTFDFIWGDREIVIVHGLEKGKMMQFSATF